MNDLQRSVCVLCFCLQIDKLYNNNNESQGIMEFDSLYFHVSICTSSIPWRSNLKSVGASLRMAMVGLNGYVSFLKQVYSHV